MTLEEQLKLNNELLQQILLHTYANTEEENKAKQEEIEELDESIEKYQSEIDELKTKLADENNYKRTKSDFELKERPVIEELLSDSIAQEREDIFKSNQLYRKEQEQQTKMLGVYNSEVVKLKDEISIIEARLNKDAIAKKRGIAKKLHLPDDEVAHLQAEVAYKKELIEEGNQVMEICADEIRRYGRLITANNDRLKHITEKEQRLSDILNSKKTPEGTDIDRYRIRLDKDELSKKIAALEAFENRKKYLLYDPSKEIREQISQNNKLLSDFGSKKSNTDVSEQSTEEFKQEVAKEEDVLKDTSEQPVNEDVTDSKEETKTENPVQPTNDELDKNKENSSEGQEKDESEFEPIPKERAIVKRDPAELVAINDAPEELKKQKLSERIKNAWKKWRDKNIALAVAAAITVTGGIALSSLIKDNSKNTATKVEKTDDFVKDNSLEDNFTFERPFETIKNNADSSKNTGQPDTAVVEPIKKSEEPVNRNDNITNTVVEQPKNNIVEEVKQPEQKPEIKVPEITPEIPEVEEEQPVKEEEKNNEGIKPEEPRLEGVINNGEIETTILQTDGEYVDILLKNGDSICVKYGDNGENVPSEITIKYDGTDMYIYSPVVNTKSL